ncbi:MAG: hypothetical protein J6K21_01840 [Bacilli bacterium]|nr:hypothetical protein [Bacilli bacterium]
MIEELSYSLHICNDKNKTSKAKKLLNKDLQTLTIMPFKMVFSYQK